jgi:hypothetical protein
MGIFRIAKRSWKDEGPNADVPAGERRSSNVKDVNLIVLKAPSLPVTRIILI